MSIKLIQDVDSLFGLFNVETISFVGMNDYERRNALDSFYKSKNMDQLEDVCQKVLIIEYLQTVLEDDGISHVILLKLKDLVVAHCFLTERVARDGRTYMEINVLCSRKFSSTGKHMLLAAENLALRRGITFTQLSAVFEAIGFYEKMGYKTVPAQFTCGAPNQVISDTTILDVFKQATQLIDSYFMQFNGVNSLSDEDRSKVTSIVLLRLNFTTAQVAFLAMNFRNVFEQWESALIYIKDNLSEYFDKDNLLLMSKCLINSSTVGIFNAGL